MYVKYMGDMYLIFKYGLDFVISFIENYLLISLLGVFLPPKRKNIIWWSLFFTMISMIINSSLFPPIYSSVFLLLLLILYAIINTTGSKKKKIIISVLIYGNLFAVNMLINIIAYVCGIQFIDFLYEINKEWLIITCIQKSILFFEYIFFEKYFKHEVYLSKGTWLTSVLLISISVVLPEIILVNFLNESIDNFYVVVGSVLEFLIINLLVYKLIIDANNDHNKILEQKILLDKNKYEEKIVGMIEKRIDKMNQLNHDFNNHKLVIEKLIAEYSNEEVSEYINEMFTLDNNVYINTKNKVFNYLLNEKINFAKEKNIDVKCLIQGDLLNDIKIVDLSIVLGNLLDNAIEACMDVDDKHIDINIMQDSHKLVISITNTFNGIIKKNDKQFLTIKKDESLHGYGISNISSICKKYNGYNYIDHDDKIFIHTCIFLID